MKAKTLFRAYQEAVDRCDWAIGTRRDGPIGVHVDDDPEAITWRRYDRLVEKIWRRLEDVFGECDAGPKEKHFV